MPWVWQRVRMTTMEGCHPLEHKGPSIPRPPTSRMGKCAPAAGKTLPFPSAQGEAVCIAARGRIPDLARADPAKCVRTGARGPGPGAWAAAPVRPVHPDPGWWRHRCPLLDMWEVPNGGRTEQGAAFGADTRSGVCHWHQWPWVLNPEAPIFIHPPTPPI